jgi:hypothetical protein
LAEQVEHQNTGGDPRSYQQQEQNREPSAQRSKS